MLREQIERFIINSLKLYIRKSRPRRYGDSEPAIERLGAGERRPGFEKVTMVPVGEGEKGRAVAANMARGAPADVKTCSGL